MTTSELHEKAFILWLAIVCIASTVCKEVYPEKIDATTMRDAELTASLTFFVLISTCD